MMCVERVFMTSTTLRKVMVHYTPKEPPSVKLFTKSFTQMLMATKRLPCVFNSLMCGLPKNPASALQMNVLCTPVPMLAPHKISYLSLMV